MAAGDRLSVKMTGTLTALAGLVVVVSLAPLQRLIEVAYTLKANTSLGTDEDLFLCDRPYELVNASEVHSTANGAALKLLLTKDTGTTAAGAGSALITDNSSTGWDLNGTAQTVQFGTIAAQQSRFLLAGDRIGLHYSTTVTSLAGLLVTVQLRPC